MIRTHHSHSGQQNTIRNATMTFRFIDAHTIWIQISTTASSLKFIIKVVNEMNACPVLSGRSSSMVKYAYIDFHFEKFVVVAKIE